MGLSHPWILETTVMVSAGTGGPCIVYENNALFISLCVQISKCIYQNFVWPTPHPNAVSAFDQSAPVIAVHTCGFLRNSQWQPLEILTVVQFSCHWLRTLDLWLRKGDEHHPRVGHD